MVTFYGEKKKQIMPKKDARKKYLLKEEYIQLKYIVA
jgi:hypothetical protein